MAKQSVVQAVAAKRAVVFDLFHTLTSLPATWSAGRRSAWEMLGVDRAAWDEQLHWCSRDRMIGVLRDPVAIVAGMARAIDPTISDERIAAATEHRIARFADALRGMPDESRRVLLALKARGQRIGLVSNADVMEVAAWGESPVADLFDSTIFSCHVGCAKPEPEIYQRSLEELGVAPEQAIFVGDGGSNELLGAREVGLTTVMMAGIIRELWPERVDELRPHADFVIERLGELVPTPRTELRLDQDLALRLVQPDDAEELFGLVDANRQHLRQWLAWVDRTTKVEHISGFIASQVAAAEQGAGYVWAIRLSGSVVGVVGFNTVDWANRKVAIGYWLASDAMGRGIMTRACRALTDHAFSELDLNRVVIAASSGNARSRAIPERLGFTQEGLFREAEWLYDRYVDHVVYAGLSRDWDRALNRCV